MSKKYFVRTSTANSVLLLQLAPWAYLGSSVLVGCANGVTGDGTQETSEPKPDGGEPDKTTTTRDAAGDDTTTAAQSSSTRPSTSSTSTSTNTPTTVGPTGTTTGANTESVEVNSSNEETTDDSSTDEGTSDTTNSQTDTDGGGTSDESTSDQIPGGQDIFIALGHGQRTTVSCDDGQTWTHNRFTDEIPSGSDTDHIPFSMRAASYDAGAFYVAWGWGYPSYVERTTDGVNWTGVFGEPGPNRSTSDWIWGLAAGDGKIAMGEGRRFFFSDDDGVNWEVSNPGVVSQKAIFGYGGGAFVVVAEGGDQGGPQFLRSTDGLSWSNEVDVPEDCIGGRVSRIPYANGTFLFAAGSHFCSSTDGGQSWQYRAVPSGQVRSSLHDGTRFISITDNGTLFASEDALEWEQIGQLPGSGGPAFGASKTTGTLVGVRGGVFYRSDNGGASFEELPGSAYTDEGGPIVQIEFGTVASSEACL